MRNCFKSAGFLSLARWSLAVQCFVLVSIAHAAPTSLCALGEKVHFSCQVGKAKTVSVCGSDAQHLQYRFGVPQQIELSYPTQAKHLASGFRLAHYARFQVDRIELSFDNKGHAFVVFDYTESGVQHAGVRVTDPKGKTQERRCITEPIDRLLQLEGRVPCDEDNALNMGHCPPP